MKTLLNVTIAALLLSSVAQAQTAATVDCNDPANANTDECLALPPLGSGDITNFVPLIGPLLGAAAVAAVAAGGASAPSTPNTNANN
ncbi:MAG: hypothetical protein AAGL89_02535 [Pseudomonadota bacterium]